MNVRCKVRVTSINAIAGYNGQAQETSIVSMSPVQGEENKTWSKWTPGGEFKLQINNPVALDQFKLGQTYFIDFSEAPQKEADEAK